MSEQVSGNLKEEMKLFRWISDHTGKFFDPQIVSLKRIALLVGNSPVTLALNIQAKDIEFRFEGKWIPGAETKLKEATAAILGSSWNAAIKFNFDSKPKKKKRKKKNGKR